LRKIYKMNKIKLLYYIIAILFFTSCSKEDDSSNSIENTKSNETPNSNKLDFSGNWTGTKFLIEKPYDFNNDGISGTDYKVELPCLIQDITLNTNGTGLYKANIHGQAEGQTTPFPLTCIEYEETPLKWSLNEKKTKIILDFTSEKLELNIVDKNIIERFSKELLDDAIGIPGKVIFERDQNDVKNTENDPILGKWKLAESLENGKPFSKFECSEKDFLTFLSTGKIIDTFFEPSTNQNANCNKIIDDSGSWKKKSESKYQIVLDEGETKYIAEIIFTENNSKQIQKYSLENEGEKFDYIDTYEKLK